MDFNEIQKYFLDHNIAAYERDNYDKFIKAQNFSFSIPCIHVTGTNGKGSVSNYISQIYISSGRRVGLFNSPYLSNPCEMIKIDGLNISAKEYEKIFNEYFDIFDSAHLTSFEIQTYLAFKFFEKEKIDIAIVEVGMGGYIDATNVIDPVLSIITSVSLEHTAYLGTSISEIAHNKAGIIKENKPVLTGKLDESALFSIREKCNSTHSELNIVDDYYNEKFDGTSWKFDFHGMKNLTINTFAMYQIKNACIAISAVEILKDKFLINEENIRNGLVSKTLECRFEFVTKNTLIDGGHNPEAIEQLMDSLIKCNNKPIHVLFAAFKDKNIDTMLNLISREASDITLTTFDHVRARTEESYFLYLGDYKFIENPFEAYESLKNAYPDDLVLICGSLAFAGVMKRYLEGKND